MSVHDFKSRAILEQMKQDEIRHGANAIGLGGRPLPAPVAAAMRATSKLMTRGSY
jgi:ubiquinone biosynthesis monooxygenase Coq7